MSEFKNKFSKAKLSISGNKTFITIDRKVLNSKELEEFRLYTETQKEQKKYEEIFGKPAKVRDIASKRIPSFLSKWAKEVVRLLIKNGEMKHQDILLELDGLPKSYNHLSKIFKTPDAKEFFQSEIVNDKSYYSLRDPSQFK